jgi:hypothetical protein
MAASAPRNLPDPILRTMRAPNHFRFLNGLGALTIIMLLVAVAPLPYGYFMLLRVVTFSFWVLLSIDLNKAGMRTPTFITIILALLFNPFFKISLGREIWMVADISAALLATTFLLKLNRMYQTNQLNQ